MIVASARPYASLHLAPHHSVFYRPDALPASQPTGVKALKATSNSELSLITV